jgi:hypothetical protein
VSTINNPFIFFTIYSSHLPPDLATNPSTYPPTRHPRPRFGNRWIASSRRLDRLNFLRSRGSQFSKNAVIKVVRQRSGDFLAGSGYCTHRQYPNQSVSRRPS